MKRKYPLIPSYMPLVRGSILEAAEAERREAGILTADKRIFHDAIMMSIALAQLWWVSEDMKSIVVDALNSGEQPPDEDHPSPHGIMVFAGGIDVCGRMIEAISWHDRQIVAAWEASPDSDIYQRARCPITIPDGMVTSIGEGGRNGVLADALAFAWSFSAEPRIACTGRGSWGGGAMPRRLSAKDVAAVKVVELRRPPKGKHEGCGDAIEHSHRWIVSGHYRNQACGSGHRDRKRIWVPPFVKGPADKPLVKKDTVFVWRR